VGAVKRLRGPERRDYFEWDQSPPGVDGREQGGLARASGKKVTINIK